MHGTFARAHRQIRRQVLFNGDQMVEIGVFGKVSNTEATLPHDGTDLVPVDLVSHRECNLGSVGDGQWRKLGYKKTNEKA